MYTVYIRLARDASNEQRESELQSQFTKGRADPLNQRVLLEGEEKSPWPEWLRDILGSYGWSYDHYNWLYQKRCRTQEQAFREQAWVIDLSKLFWLNPWEHRAAALWRMKSFWLWKWIYKRRPERVEVVLRMDPTILQDVTIDGVPGTGTGDEEAELA